MNLWSLLLLQELILHVFMMFHLYYLLTHESRTESKSVVLDSTLPFVNLAFNVPEKEGGKLLTTE